MIVHAAKCARFCQISSRIKKYFSSNSNHISILHVEIDEKESVKDGLFQIKIV